MSGAVSVLPEEQAWKDAWVARNLLSATDVPAFSFAYGGLSSSSFLPSWTRTVANSALDANRTQHTVVWTNAGDNLRVRCVAIEYADYPVVEWTVYLENVGTSDTPILQNVKGLNTAFSRGASGEFVVNGIAGDDCTATSFQPYSATLGPSASRNAGVSSGKSSDGPNGWPYFNLQIPSGADGTGGVIVAVGWPGNWSASFTRDASTGLTVQAGQGNTYCLLHPGETLRTPSTTLFFWHGTNLVRAQNLWRRWYLAHLIPRVAGAPPTPLAQIQVGGNDTNYVDSFTQAGIAVDICWRDAGGSYTWYKNNNSPYTGNDAWLNTGTWEVDPAKYPDGFKPFSDWIHARGMKFVLWFEPERIGDMNSWLGVNHPEWLLSPGSVGKILNQGNPTVFNWLTNHFDNLIKSNGVDWYREDMNGNGPGPTWASNDAGNRKGITENFYVQGHLAFWDALLAMNPGLRIDSCASGGRRNDLETMRRSVPLLRSDFQFPSMGGVVEGNQGHTYGLSSWLPFQGSGLYSYDVYSFRSFYLPSFGMGTLDGSTRSAQQQAYSECRIIAPCMLYGDYYPLTPYSLATDAWIAWQFDYPGGSNGAVQAFRRAASPVPEMQFTLNGLDPAKYYRVRDFDKGVTPWVAGQTLLTTGLTVRLNQREAAVIYYEIVTGVIATATADTSVGLLPLAVQFSATGMAGDGNPVTYSWTFGDGGVSSQQSPSHVYTNSGRFVAEVTAQGQNGATGKAQVSVTVLGAAHRMRIAFPAYNREEPLTNFTALVVFGTNLAANGFAYSQMASTNGWDLVFTDSGVTRELNYEIEQRDTNGLTLAWVQVPVLASNSCIWAYWGDAGITSSPAAYTTNGAAWGGDFSGVWHFTGGATLSGKDSTARAWNGAVHSAIRTNGVMAEAAYFDGSSAYLDMGTSEPMRDGKVTMGAWIRPLNGTVLMMKGDDNTVHSYGLEWGAGASLLFTYGAGTAWLGDGGVSPAGQWSFVSGVIDGNSKRIYVNGALRASTTFSGSVSSALPLWFGAQNRVGFPYWYQGAMDEARISSVARSANWIWAEWMNLASNSVFLDYGTVGNGATPIARFVAEPSSGVVPLTVSFSDTSMGSVTGRVWSFGDGTTQATTAATVFHVYSNAGTYDVELNVSGTNGSVSLTQHGCVVATAQQLPLAGFSASPTYGAAPVTVAFTDTSSGTITNRLWDLGDGTVLSTNGTDFLHVYSTAGTYRVVLTAFGPLGQDTLISNGCVTVLGSWFDGWNRQMRIMFEGYDSSEPLTQFPALVALGTNLPGFSYADFASADGWDLRFGEVNGTNELPYEIERWNTNGTSLVWVRVSELTNNAGIVAYWRNATATVQPSYTTNGDVWANGYAGVWHLPDGVTLRGTDSTAGRNSGTPRSGAVAVEGRIGGGGRFDGTFNAYVGVGPFNPLPGGLGTVSIWFNLDANSVAKNNYLIAKGDDNGTVSWGLDVIPAADGARCELSLLYGQAKWVSANSVPAATGTWHLVTAVMKPNSQEIYLDGGLQATGNKATITPAAGAAFYIGKTQRAAPYDYAANGTLDEARVATAQRSANWVRAEYLNVVSNAVFSRCGNVRSTTAAYEQWRRMYFSQNQLADAAISGDGADPDGDTMSNLQEFLAGTVPTNRDSCLVITGSFGVTNTLVLRWQSVAGKYYSVRGCTNLLSGDFSITEATGIPGVEGQQTWTVGVSRAYEVFRINVEQ